MIENFHFIRPWWLLALAVGLWLIYLLWKRVNNETRWRDICDRHLIGRQLTGKRGGRGKLPYLGLAMIWLLACIAVSGPSWEKTPQRLFKPMQSRVIVFDLSRSMDSVDVKPSRLARARYKLTDLILSGRGIQQGLVVFAGDAFIVSPITDDRNTLANFIPSLKTDTVPVQGSRADLGLKLAASLYENSGFRNKEIILIADGAADKTAEIASALQSNGIKISVMAVGTAEGGPIHQKDGTLLKDKNGNIVIAGVDYAELSAVAANGNGEFVVMQNDDSDIRALSRLNLNIPTPETSEQALRHKNSALDTGQWKDFGPWILLPVLLLSAFSFRRGWILCLSVLIMPALPTDSYAFSWQQLWLRDDQIAAKHFNADEFDQITDSAPPLWKGAAKYRSEDYSGAAREYENGDITSARTHFNRGNSLARDRSFEEAIAAYQKALDIDPDYEEAGFNKDLIEKLLEQSRQQNNQSPPESEQNDPQDFEQNQKKNKDRQQGRNTDAYDTARQSGDAQSQIDKQARSNKDKKSKNDEPEREARRDTGDEDEQYIGGDKADGTEDQKRQYSRSRQPLSEQQQAMEQWLQRIPDDPGGLLKRKFARQYSLREPQTHERQW